MCDNQNKRVPNFSSSEIELLVTLVKKYSNILENKKTDAVNNKLKEETWCKLCEDFNSTSGIYQRNAKTLRSKYENFKKSLKRKYGEHRRSLYRTGGGPSQDLNFTQEEEAILALAGPSIEGLPARHDSDTIPHEEIKIIPQPKVTVEELTQNTNECCYNNPKMEAVSSMSEGNPCTTEVYLDATPNRFLLKRKRSTPLRSRNPEVFNDTMENFSNLSKKKQELVDAQIRSIEEKRAQDMKEYELRCAQAKKEHDLKCELMQLEIMLKKKGIKPDLI